MNSTLKVIQVLLGLIELAQAAGVDVSRLLEAKRKAEAEGRDLSDAELEDFKLQAQTSIDAAREA